jgi:branched-subunit amino acid transport protein AzlD
MLALHAIIAPIAILTILALHAILALNAILAPIAILTILALHAIIAIRAILAIIPLSIFLGHFIFLIIFNFHKSS